MRIYRLLGILTLLVTSYGLLVTDSFAQEETLTITTYYPSPYGVYRDARVTNSFMLQAEPVASDGPQIEWRTSSVGTDRHWNIDQYGDRLRFFTERNSDDGAGAERMTILENGNLGIGTTSPNTKLHVAGSLQLLDTSANGEAIYWGEATGDTQLYFRWGTPAGYTDRMVIRGSDGNVGIGTTNPQKTLHVNGTVYLRHDNCHWVGGSYSTHSWVTAICPDGQYMAGSRAYVDYDDNLHGDNLYLTRLEVYCCE